MVWFGIQTYFGALFLDIVFMCVFGHSWTNMHNSLPESAGTTTRFVRHSPHPYKKDGAKIRADGSIFPILVFPIRLLLLPPRPTPLAHHPKSIHDTLRLSRPLHLGARSLRRTRRFPSTQRRYLRSKQTSSTSMGNSRSNQQRHQRRIRPLDCIRTYNPLPLH